MSDIGDIDMPGEGFGGGEIIAASTALLGGVIFIPDPSGFDALMRVNGPVGKALKRWAEDTQRMAQGMAPVDTGELRDSIQISYGKSSDGIYADIGSDVFYAGYQELGTSRNPPHPFLRPALAAALAEIQDSSILGGYADEVDVSFSYQGEGDYANTGYTDTAGG